MKRKLGGQNIQNDNFAQETLVIPIVDATYANEGNSVVLLQELREIEQQLLMQNSQIIDTLVKWQSMFDSVSDQKSRIMTVLEKNLSKQEGDERAEELKCEESVQPSGDGESSCMLFSVVSGGSSWDGLVFTVMAENDAWAEMLVREWLDRNGRENHKIDKVMALVSRDARGIINVGEKLLDV